MNPEQRKARDRATEKRYRESLKRPENAERLEAARVKRRALGKKWRETNPEASSASQKKYRDSHRAERSAKKRAWYAENREAELARNKHYNGTVYRERAIDKRLQRLYGITLSEYLERSERQGQCCAICKRKRRLAVDHCHSTNQVRGLLCRVCNSAIGKLGDTAAGVRAALNYLIEWEQKHGPLEVAS